MSEHVRKPGPQETFEKLEEYLGELFEEPYHDPENDHFYVRYGTTVLEISVEPYGSEEAVVDHHVLLRAGRGARRGAAARACSSSTTRCPAAHFSVVGNDIFFAHSMFGRSLEPRDLLRAITAVATIADDYDDRIVARYGGQTALERIQDTGGRRRRAGEETESDLSRG